MIIISDCFTEKTDEGCIKVAVSLAKRLKALRRNVTLISYKNHSDFADKNIKLNSLFLNLSLFRTIRSDTGEILYIPFASNTFASILRTFTLSLMSRKRVSVIFVMRRPMNRIGVWLLQKSRAQIIALSKKSLDFYQRLLKNPVTYIKTGVDTECFQPVSGEKKRLLRQKYGIPEDMPVFFHAGHLKAGRNIGILSGIPSDFYVLLAVSSVTLQEQDFSIRSALERRPNTKIIDSYVPQIEELYQLADGYIFPVEEGLNCIDIPVSVMEAAACNLPIITTPYGELQEFRGRDGFYFIDHMTVQALNKTLDTALTQKSDTRSAVLEYDWTNALQIFLQLFHL